MYLLTAQCIFLATESTCPDASQYGQSSFFLSTLRQQNHNVPKTFIEFGCADGRENSNTWMLECLGWHGFCIEPIDTIRERKHGYRGVVCAPKKEGKTENVVVSRLPGLHGIKPNLAAFGTDAVRTERVKCLNLNTLRRQLNMTEVGYMTVDTEGNEASLLRAYKPDWAVWIQVECNDRAACDAIKSIMRPRYILVHVFLFHNGRGGADMLWRRRQRTRSGF